MGIRTNADLGAPCEENVVLVSRNHRVTAVGGEPLGTGMPRWMNSSGSRTRPVSPFQLLGVEVDAVQIRDCWEHCATIHRNRAGWLRRSFPDAFAGSREFPLVAMNRV